MGEVGYLQYLRGQLKLKTEIHDSSVQRVHNIFSFKKQDVSILTNQIKICIVILK